MFVIKIFCIHMSFNFFIYSVWPFTLVYLSNGSFLKPTVHWNLDLVLPFFVVCCSLHALFVSQWESLLAADAATGVGFTAASWFSFLFGRVASFPAEILGSPVSASGIITNLSTTILGSPIAIAGLGNPSDARAGVTFLLPLIMVNWDGN